MCRRSCRIRTLSLPPMRTALVFLCASATALSAQTPLVAVPHERAPTAVAARRNGPISIDGKMDEAAWQAATPVTDFRQYDPHEGQSASEKTEARILIDDDAVYVGMRMFDSQPNLIPVSYTHLRAHE